MLAPNLFRAVGPRRRQRTVREALNDRQWTTDITGAPTVPVINEYFRVWDLVEQVQLQPERSDRFV